MRLRLKKELNRSVALTGRDWILISNVKHKTMKKELLNNIRGMLSTGKANLSNLEFEELLDEVQSEVDTFRDSEEETEESEVEEEEEDEDA